MQASIQRVERAIEELKLGRMIILTDHPDRENEGDIIVAAEFISHETMNFMIQHCSGIVCIPMSNELADHLDLPLMIANKQNTCTRNTAFTISIDARDGISTGVSVADRINTVLTVVSDKASAASFVRPGHLFPLRANDNGVLKRKGHTEGSVDLMRIAGLKPAAVICEIMNQDGSMARGKQLDLIAEYYGIMQLSIEDIVQYRLCNENLIIEEARTKLPTREYGELDIQVVRDRISMGEHIIISKQINNQTSDLVRIHSSCMTGDLFTSLRCDCHDQLHYSLDRIANEGGYLIYLNQEGRGIGLLNKIKAYALQEKGFDTVEANQELGLDIDLRDYQLAANILHKLSLKNIRLLTNNPDKVKQLQECGINHIQRESTPVFKNCFNEKYLSTKREKLNHDIDLELSA